MTNYYTITIGNKDYKCKLTTGNIIDCEQKLGGNLIQVFFNMRTGKLPTVKEMVTIFHYSLLAYNHGITMEDTYNLFDSWLEQNHVMGFIQILVEIFKVSGIIKQDIDQEEEKN